MWKKLETDEKFIEKCRILEEKRRNIHNAFNRVAWVWGDAIQYVDEVTEKNEKKSKKLKSGKKPRKKFVYVENQLFCLWNRYCIRHFSKTT